ncbi:MAG: outer membrane beta-barrel protein [Arenimonas sp.]
MKRSLFALALAAALPLSAQAGEVNYSYVQAGYSSTRVEGGDFNGWGVEGSAGFNDNFYIFGGYKTGDEGSLDLNQTNVGLGWHSTGDLQWFVEGSWINNEVDYGGGFSDDDNGHALTVGLRTFFGDNFEMDAEVNYTDVGDFGDGVGLGASGIYHFNETWGAYASYDYSDRGSYEFNTWGLGVRASF